MKKLLLVLSLVLVFSFAACVPEPDEDELQDILDKEKEEEADGPIKLGVLGPLSGEYSMYGVAVRDGALLAMEEINAAGGVLGRDLEIIAYDTEGAADKGVNAYNLLKDRDGIHALIGGTFSGVTLAIKELAVPDNMPILTPTATHPDVTLNAPNVFRACYTDSYQGEVAAVFIDETLGKKKVAVLYNQEDAYSTGLAEAFKAEYAGRGTVVLDLAFAAADTDFSSLLSQIAASDAEAVFLPGYVAEVGVILTQAKAAGLTIPFVGGDGWDGVEADYADAAEGHYFANHYAKTDPAQNIQDFVANFTAKYKEAPNALAALAYDAVYAMAAALEDAGSTDADDLIAALASLDYADAVTGAIKFDADGNPIKAVTMIQIVNGEHEVKAKVSVN
jgi:branched-chain amino acid transport system substrate-binding protein